MADEIQLVDYTSPEGARVTHVRSTLLSSSIQTLREYGLFDRYVELLPDEYHDAIVLSMAPEWLPLELGMVHYRACDELGLSDDDLDRIGEAVSERIMGTFLGHIMRSTRNVGSTPWVPLKRYGRIWSRVMKGGRCRVIETGPKDARIESFGAPMFQFHYFRVAYVGVIKGAVGMFAKKVFVRQEGPTTGSDRLVATVSWV